MNRKYLAWVFLALPLLRYHARAADRISKETLKSQGKKATDAYDLTLQREMYRRLSNLRKRQYLETSIIGDILAKCVQSLPIFE